MATERRDVQLLYAAQSCMNQLTSSSAATGYNFSGWSVTNFTPNRNVRGDDTLATLGRTVATLINDLIIKTNPS